jgi:hypothetical protein
MGFEWKKITLLRRAAEYPEGMKYSSFSGDESEIGIVSNVAQWTSVKALKINHLEFTPPAGWRNYVEVSHVD